MKIFSANKGLRVLFYSLILASLPVSALARAHASPNGKEVFQQTISGVVADSSGPLPGVIISVKGTTRSVVTDQDGKYLIMASNDELLVFSFTGYKTVEVIIGAQSTVNILLQEDATQLEELEINAGYYSVKQKESTGSIARITAKDIETQPVTNVLATMQGRMAGVSITQDTGTPGGAFTIRIRGQNSLRQDANQPLYIIDGVPYASESIGSADTSVATQNAQSPLNSINPSDIESIEVLKDADATAIYGSRGANGVVLITTKRGFNTPAKFSFTASSGFGSLARKMDLMNTDQYLRMRRAAFANDGIAPYPDYAYDVNGTWDQYRNTDWQETLIGGTSEIHSYQGSVSGGSANTSYLLSGSFRQETTVLPGDFKYSKGAVHFNMAHRSDDNRFKIQFSANYIAQNNILPATDMTRLSRTLAPNAPALYNGDGSLNWAEGTWDNPLSELQQDYRSKTYDLIANSVISYELFNGLQAKISLGYTDLKNNEVRTVPSTLYNPAYGLGSESSSLNTNYTTRRSYIIEPQLNYNVIIGRHKLDVLIGSTLQNQKSERLQALGFGFSSNALIYDLSSASTKFITLSDEPQYKYLAYFSRVNYNYDGRYIINITGRRDGSSRFGTGNQFANFGAIGCAWIFSKEAVLDYNSILSFGKLRASYGITGSDQIGDYQYMDTYGSAANQYGGVIGLNPIRLYNPAFGWESNKKTEIALETGFLKDRLFLSAAWYSNRSSSQLVGMPMPGTTGFQSLTANLDAIVRNQGWEFTLHSENIALKNFNWSTDFNISLNRNKLLKYPNLESSPYANTYTIGQPLNIIKLYHYTGQDPDTGIYTFEDKDRDGQITATGDRITQADLNPRYFGGIQNHISYKQWTLDFLFQFVRQKSLKYLPAPGGTSVNQLSEVSNSSWQQAGDIASYQPYTTGVNSQAVTAYYNYAQSDGGVTDASYIRLKNISLSYDLPLTHKAMNCRLSLQGQNILTFTKFNGDPESRFANALPPLKFYTLGVQLNF
ncbi:TonB-dependent receptor [Flavobacterium akiainvivens]|uniref:TonB-dependent receptor n=1 Tax=Flavobacterium akiainvivens TaxID=1202724 RepID=A0A0M8M9M5_9FLAO|nr:SusC/RagA family TonB-linked outer membrane protein [Flavobacterium akiainvivens]KOS05425.1 TonB-dependent receptor [Flavobacterium akiainvivens]SFQ78219.1 TonB-linked outer membrane protein, SusC/RagA family [Flavobacterium akiainvivens]